MTPKGNLVIISGFSGVGKGTVVHSLMSRHTGYALSVSCTTRAPRPGEKDGADYFYITQKEFDSMIERGEFLEYARYVDHSYGTPGKYVKQKLEEGLDVILEIEIQGAMKVRRQYPEAVLIFIMPPDFETLKNRLAGRGSETADVIRARLKRAAAESEGIEQYDYIFINDIADDCADRIHRLLRSLRSRTSSNRAFIEKIRNQIEEFRNENANDSSII